MIAAEDSTRLFERYKLAVAECRAEISLGWERQKLFLTLNPTLTAIVGVAARSPTAARAALVAAALTALAGAFIVQRSHARYRSARDTAQRLETELGIADLQTTGGQREARGLPRGETYRVIDVVIWVSCVNAALDLALAAWWP